MSKRRATACRTAPLPAHAADLELRLPRKMSCLLCKSLCSWADALAAAGMLRTIALRGRAPQSTLSTSVCSGNWQAAVSFEKCKIV